MKKKNVDMEKKQDENINLLKKDNNNRLIITVCVAIALTIGLYFTYSKLLNSKKLFIKAINKEYSKLEEQIDKYVVDNKDAKTIMMTSNIKFKMEMDEAIADNESKKLMKEYNKLKISEKIGIDQKKNEMIMNLRYLYADEDMINIGTYLKDKKLYLELKNIFDKYIELPMSNSIDFDNADTNKISKEEFKYLLKTTKDALINNMNSKDFKQSTEKIKDGRKIIKVSKITYGLSEKSATELMIKFYEEIGKDSKYIKILSKLIGEKESKVKESIKEVTNEMKSVIKDELLSKDVKVRFGILVKGISKKYVGLSFETVDEAKLIYYKNGNNKEIRISKKDEDLIRASKKDNKTVITFISEGKETTLTIDKTEKNKKTTYNYELEASGMKISGKFIIEKIKENKDGTNENKFSLDISMMGMITFKIYGNIKIENVDKLDIPNISNSIKAEDLSESDTKKIMEKLMNNETLKSFLKIFGSEEELVIE